MRSLLRRAIRSLPLSVIAAVAISSFAPASADATYFQIKPDGDGAATSSPAGGGFRKPLVACDGTFTTANLYMAIDEGSATWDSTPCTEYVYSYTPSATQQVTQEFTLQAPPVGTFTVNSLDLHVVLCSETATDPPVTFELFHGAGIQIGTPQVMTSISSCSGAPTQARLEFRDVSVTRAQLVDAYLKVTVDKSSGTPTVRFITMDVEGDACTANFCGFARNDTSDTPAVWPGCPGVNVITVRVNGGAGQTVNCTASGEFAYTGGVITAGSIITAYFTDATRPTHFGVTYFRADGDGNQSAIYRDAATLETIDGNPMTNANITVWDATNDPAWLSLDATGTTLVETRPTTIEVVDSAAASTWKPGGNVTVSGVASRAPVDPDSHTLTLTGSGTSTICSNPIGTKMPYCRAGGSINADTSTLRFTGSGDINIPTQTYYNLEHVPSAGSPVLEPSSITVSSDLVLGGGGGNSMPDLASIGAITVGDDLTINAGSALSGPDTSTITVGGDMTGAGAVSLSGSGRVVLRNNGTRSFGPTVAGTTWTLQQLEVSNDSGVSTGAVNLVATGTGDIVVLGNVTVAHSADTRSTNFNLDTLDRTLDVGGILTINAQGTLNAPSSDTLRLRDNFVVSNGVFNDNGGTVDLQPTKDGTGRLTWAAGGESFATLTLTGGGRIEFDSARTTTVNASLSVNGTNCYTPDRMNLVSDVFGDRWDIDVNGTHSIINAAVQDSNAIDPLLGTTPSLDSGNNVNWAYAPGACQPAAPNGLLTQGLTQPTAIGMSTPTFSVVNRATLAVDQQRIQVYSTLPDDVLSHWRFDGSAADSVGANPGTLTAGATATGTAKPNFGQSLDLDGVDDWVAVADHASLRRANAFTIEAWFRPDDLSIDYPVLVQRSADNGCSTDCNYSLQFDMVGANDRVCGRVSVGGSGQSACSANGLANSLVDGEWHHAALTVTAGNVMQLYVDGAPHGSAVNLGGSVVANPSPLGIGAFANGFDGYFDGSIDDVRFSAAARTAAEIRGAYRTQRPHATVMWDSSPSDAGVAIASCANAVRCADVTYGTGGGAEYLINDGARYYVRTKVRNAADGVWSGWGSDWFETSASINIGVTPSVDLGFLASGADTVVEINATVDTNNATGYTLTAEWDAIPMTHSGGVATVPDFVPTIPDLATVWPAGAESGFGLTVLGAATSGVPYPRLTRWGVGTDTSVNDFVNNRFAGLAVASPIVLHRRTTFDPAVDTVDIGLRANVGPGQLAGSYDGELVFTALPNP